MSTKRIWISKTRPGIRLVISCSLRISQLLIEFGCNIHLRNNRGKTPCDIEASQRWWSKHPSVDYSQQVKSSTPHGMFPPRSQEVTELKPELHGEMRAKDLLLPQTGRLPYGRGGCAKGWWETAKQRGLYEETTTVTLYLHARKSHKFKLHDNPKWLKKERKKTKQWECEFMSWNKHTSSLYQERDFLLLACLY